MVFFPLFFSSQRCLKHFSNAASSSQPDSKNKKTTHHRAFRLHSADRRMDASSDLKEVIVDWRNDSKQVPLWWPRFHPLPTPHLLLMEESFCDLTGRESWVTQNPSTNSRGLISQWVVCGMQGKLMGVFKGERGWRRPASWMQQCEWCILCATLSHCTAWHWRLVSTALLFWY